MGGNLRQIVERLTKILLDTGLDVQFLSTDGRRDILQLVTEGGNITLEGIAIGRL